MAICMLGHVSGVLYLFMGQIVCLVLWFRRLSWLFWYVYIVLLECDMILFGFFSSRIHSKNLDIRLCCCRFVSFLLGSHLFSHVGVGYMIFSVLTTYASSLVYSPRFAPFLSHFDALALFHYTLIWCSASVMIHHQLRYINKLCFLHLCWSTQLADLQLISFLTICICACSHGHRLKKWTRLPLQLQVQGTMSGLAFFISIRLAFLY